MEIEQNTQSKPSFIQSHPIQTFTNDQLQFNFSQFSRFPIQVPQEAQKPTLRRQKPNFKKILSNMFKDLTPFSQKETWRHMKLGRIPIPDVFGYNGKAKTVPIDFDEEIPDQELGGGDFAGEAVPEDAQDAASPQEEGFANEVVEDGGNDPSVPIDFDASNNLNQGQIQTHLSSLNPSFKLFETHINNQLIEKLSPE